MMNSKNNILQRGICMRRQGGVVLFIALIALVTILLAAVALVRSVDTSSLIAGNIAFRRAATSSADGGLEGAISWLAAQQKAEEPKNPDIDPSHVLNITNKAKGYYSNLDESDTNLVFTSAKTWTDEFSGYAGKDANGNDVRYVIQRMCTTENTIPKKDDCVFSDAETKTSSQGNLNQAEKPDASPMYRVTVRVTGPRNTISYIQGFIY